MIDDGRVGDAWAFGLDGLRDIDYSGGQVPRELTRSPGAL